MIAAQDDALRNAVAELIIIRASGHLFDAQRKFPQWELKNRSLKRLLEEGVGGVILVGGSTYELQQRTKMLRHWSAKQILLCADVEEGMGQRFEGGTWFVPPMALSQIHTKQSEKAIFFAEKYGMSIACQAKSCGLNWVLAPVCDINTNFSNPVINVRAWGENSLTVSELACAFQRGVASQKVLTCAKHFPGHGDTSIDSHLALPKLDHDLQRLETVEFIPFRDLIASGVDSVMTAHILLSQIDPNHPATLSFEVINGLLREKIGFEGLVVTDALVMEAICKRYGCGEAAVMAFRAGADLLMMPSSPDEAISAICQALVAGQIPMRRLEQSLCRRRKALLKVEVLQSEAMEPNDIPDDFKFESGEDVAFSKDLILHSIDINHKLVGEVERSGINLVRVDNIFSCRFLNINAPALNIPEEFGYRTVICHKQGITPWQKNPEEPFAIERFGQGSFFLQLFIRGNPFLGNRYQEEPWIAAIRQLQRLNRLAGIVVYGSPYLGNDIKNELNPAIPFAYSPGQIPEAQKYALSSLFQLKKLKLNSNPTEFSMFTD